jgi:hypothetical protein
MVAPRNDVRLTRGASRRLDETIDNCRLSSAYSGVLERLMTEYPIPKDISERQWAITAKKALSARRDGDLREVFTFFELDPDDPWAWRALAGQWAYVLFRPSRAGRPSEWTDMKYCELIREVGRRKQRTKVPLSDRAICGHIAEDKASPAYFRKAKESGVRKALERARSEKHNGILRDLIDELIAKSVFTRDEARDLAIRAIEKYTGDKTRV